jgi:RNA polymerase sigma-70 factor (ECF subfamily)
MPYMPIRKETAVQDDRLGFRRATVENSEAEFYARKFEDEFEALVEQFKRPLVAFLCRLLGDQRSAEDVAVKTFLRLYRLAVRGVADGEFVIAVYRVAIAAAAQRHPESSVDVVTASTPSAGTPTGIQASIRRCIAEVSEIERLAILLHKYQNLNCAQIGSVLSLSETDVKALLLRAYRSVQHRLCEGSTE